MFSCQRTLEAVDSGPLLIWRGLYKLGKEGGMSLRVVAGKFGIPKCKDVWQAIFLPSPVGGGYSSLFVCVCVS